jgi:hypothetical protein
MIIVIDIKPARPTTKFRKITVAEHVTPCQSIWSKGTSILDTVATPCTEQKLIAA